MQWLDEKCGLEASIQHLKNQMGVDRDHFEHELKNRETRLRLMTDTVDQVRGAFANSAKELSEKHQEAQHQAAQFRAELFVLFCLFVFYPRNRVW